jgi:hypothetical protein
MKESFFPNQRTHEEADPQPAQEAHLESEVTGVAVEKEKSPLEVFHETALQRIQVLEESGVYPKWYADERRDILTDFTPETQEEDGITAENAKEKALSYAEAVVGVFEDFREKFDQKGKEVLKRLEGVFSIIERGINNPDLNEDAKNALIACRAELADIRDELILYVVKVKKDVRIDEESAATRDGLFQKINTLSEKVTEELGEAGKFSIADPVEAYERQERLDDLEDETVSDFLGRESGQESVKEVKGKVLERINELSDLMASLETVSPEMSADHFADYYFPVIEAVRNASNYKEIAEALDKISPDDLTKRFYSTYKKKKLGLFSIVTQVGKGSFPTYSEEFNALLKTQQTIKLLAAIESDRESL